MQGQQGGRALESEHMLFLVAAVRVPMGCANLYGDGSGRLLLKNDVSRIWFVCLFKDSLI